MFVVLNAENQVVAICATEEEAAAKQIAYAEANR